MKFNYNCNEIDGLVLIDEKYLDEINEELLYALDIFLDRYGKSELIYDFPDEEWAVVRARETEGLKSFCNEGKMILFLLDNEELECEILCGSEEIDTDMYLDVASGKIILVNASELIQCLAYPDLVMESILEINDMEKGLYAIKNDSIRKIYYKKSITSKTIFSNVIEL